MRVLRFVSELMLNTEFMTCVGRWPCSKSSLKGQREGILKNNYGFTAQIDFSQISSVSYDLWLSTTNFWVNLQLPSAHPSRSVWATNYFNRPLCDSEMPLLWQTVTAGDELRAFSAAAVAMREILRDSLQYLPIITLWLRGCEGEKTQAH